MVHSSCRSICHSSEPQTSTVRVSSPRPKCLGHRSSEYKLVGSHCLCLPTDGSPSQGDPKSPAIQLPDHLNSPRLVRDALVLGRVSLFCTGFHSFKYHIILELKANFTVRRHILVFMSSLCGVGVRVNNFFSKTTRPRDMLFFLKDTLSIEDEKLFKACKSVCSSVC